MIKYLKESFEELNNVTWPTRKQGIKITTIVLIFMVLSAAVLGLVDYLFAQGLKSIINNNQSSVVSTEVTPTDVTTTDTVPVDSTSTEVTPTPTETIPVNPAQTEVTPNVTPVDTTSQTEPPTTPAPESNATQGSETNLPQ